MKDAVADAEYAELVAARWLALVRTAVALGCSLPEAEDLVQAALVQCYVKWHQVAAAEHRDAYVAKILLNTVRSAKRRGRGTREVAIEALPDIPVDDGADQRAAAEALRRAVAGLSPGQREVVALRFYVRLTESETAEVLGVAPGTVKSRLSRALAVLAADASLDDLRTGRS